MSLFKKKPKNPVEVTNLDKNTLNKQQKSPNKEKKLTKSAFTRDFIEASKGSFSKKRLLALSFYFYFSTLLGKIIHGLLQVIIMI